MSKFLMTVRLDGLPTLEAAAKALGVPQSDIDPAYGVVEVDPDLKLFAVQIERFETSSKTKLQSNLAGKYRGPFSNPRISPFGPTLPIAPKVK